MKRFLFNASDGKGGWVQGRLTAVSEREARREIQKRGLDPVSVQPDPGLIGWWRRLQLHLPANLSSLALATRQLATMLNVGIDISHCLDVLRAADYGARLNLAWDDMSRSLQRGWTLSRALGRHPGVFSPVYRGLVRAGETSGSLVANLNTIADHLERELRLRQRLKAALMYPAFVFCVCVVAVLLLTQKVLPTLIQGLFTETGVRLPFMTQTVIWAGNALNSPVFYNLVLPLVILFGLAFIHYSGTAGGRYRLQWFARRIPLLSSLVETTVAARFSRTMSALIACGIPLIHSLELTDMVLADYTTSRAIDKLIVGVENGEPFTELMREAEGFPPLVAGFTELGEETGRMALAYRRLAEMLEEEIDLLLNTLTAALEPLMVGAMGALVGYIVIAMFLPLYRMLSFS